MDTLFTSLMANPGR
jgi:hypothetical protein